jgi:hypothetical protein
MDIKLNLSLIILMLLLCIGCEKTKTNGEAQKLIIEHFKLLNNQNLKSLKKQYSNDAIILSPKSPYLSIGVDGLMREYELYFTYCSNTLFKIQRIIATDSTVAIEYKIIGQSKKLKPPFLTNFYPNGIELNNCNVFKIKDGKIVNETIYSNNVSHD